VTLVTVGGGSRLIRVQDGFNCGFGASALPGQKVDCRGLVQLSLHFVPSLGRRTLKPDPAQGAGGSWQRWCRVV